MFDKLIVTEPAAANMRNRGRYFLGTSLVVGVLFLVAVVVSIFATDYGLGTDSFEITELIAPVMQVPQTEPEPPKPQAPASPSRSDAQMPTRQVNMQNLSESKPIVPKETSVTPNTQLARPDGRFEISNHDSNPGTSAGTGRDTSFAGDGPALAANVPPAVENEPVPEPPRAKPPTPPGPPPIKSMGVINGQATSLPKPNYPPAALAANMQGSVSVQVLIDESGRVISAKAVSGNGLLKSAAEQAARNARFSPTLLSKVPVKVTGVIIYSFTRG